MSNDRAFATFALCLLAAVASVITCLILFGFTEIPPAGVFLQEVLLGLTFRGAYKSFDGSNWPLEFLQFLGLFGHDRDGDVDVDFGDGTASAMG